MDNENKFEEVVVEESQPVANKKNVCGIISLVLGILSLVTLCTTGSVLGLIGIILAIVAMTARKEPKKGIAKAGLITSIIAFIFGVAIIVVAIFAVKKVEQTLVESGMTMEQVQIIESLISPEDVVTYTNLYNDYTSGNINPEDITLEMLGLEKREYSAEEKDALRALARSLGLDEETIQKGEAELEQMLK